MLELYAAIWRVSGRRQIILIVLSLAIAALAAVPLDFQKNIVNALTDGSTDRDGLIRLCSLMLAAILLSLALKWLLGYRSSVLGEDTIRLIRNRIYVTATGPNPARGLQVGGGTLTTVISAEAEELGKFSGAAFSEPVVQTGTLVSVVGYIASTQPGLGAIALCMIFPQIILVLLTQNKVNTLVEERVRVLRGASDRIDSQTAEAVKKSVIADFNRIYETRRRMFIWAPRFLTCFVFFCAVV